jgi:cytochrome c peroxidase
LRPEDEGKMKTPTLRNITVTSPYMHDGRFKTLDEVLEFYNTGFHYHPNLDRNLALAKKGRLSEQDKKDIIAFISTFTDEEFLKNPAYRK